MHTNRFACILCLALLCSIRPLAIAQPEQDAIPSTSVYDIYRDTITQGKPLTQGEKKLLTPFLRKANSNEERLKELLKAMGHPSEKVRNVVLKAFCMLLKADPSLAQKSVIVKLRHIIQKGGRYPREASDQVIAAYHALIYTAPRLIPDTLHVAMAIVEGKLHNAQKDNKVLPTLFEEMVNTHPALTRHLLHTARRARVNKKTSYKTRVHTLLPIYYIADSEAMKAQKGDFFLALTILQNALLDPHTAVKELALRTIRVLLKANATYAQEWFQKHAQEAIQGSDYGARVNALVALQTYVFADPAKYGPQSLKIATEALKDASEEARICAIEVIVAMATTDVKEYGDFALNAMRKASQDPSLTVVKWTCRFLEKLVADLDKEYSDEAFEILKWILYKKGARDDSVRSATLHALGSIVTRDKSLVVSVKKMAIAAMKDGAHDVRLQAVKVLTIIVTHYKAYTTDTAIWQTAEKASKDRQQNVRQCANELLAKLSTKVVH